MEQLELSFELLSYDVPRTRELALILSVLALSCSTPATYRAQTPILPRAESRLFELLPEGAQSCSLAWPGRVPSARREFLKTIVRSAPIAWGPRAPFSVWAQVEQRTPGMTPALVAVVRVSSLSAARAYFRAQRQVPVHWEEPRRCPEPGCHHYFAQEIDERTIQVTRGTWREGTERLSVPRCDQANSDALVEVFASGAQWGRGASEDLLDHLGYAAEVRLELNSHGLRWREVVHAEDPALARRAARVSNEMEAELAEDGFSMVAAMGSRRVARGSDVFRSASFVWEDFEMAAADARYWRQAIAFEAMAARPLSVARIDYTNRVVVTQQLRLRQRRLEELQGDERREEALAIRRILEEALAVHLDDHDYSLALTRVLLDPLQDGQAARGLVERALELGEGDPRQWRLLLRHALALSDENALRDALLQDEVAGSVRDATEAAHVLSSIAPRTSYEEAEGAWMAARAMRDAPDRLQPTTPANLPLSSLFETLLALAEQRDMTTRSVHVRLHTSAAITSGAHGSAMQRTHTWERDEEWTRVGAGLTDAPDGLHGLGQAMVLGVVDGDLDLTVSIVPLGGDLRQPEESIRVRGTVQDGLLQLSETDRPDLGWANVALYLAAPLETLADRLFPPPDIEAHVPEDQMDALLELAEADDILLCGPRRGGALYCTASSDRMVTRRAWRVIVSDLLTQP